MLTKRKIKKFCIHVIGIFLVNANEDIQVERSKGTYTINIKNKRAPNHIIQRTWQRHSEGTEFERVYLNLISSGIYY